MKRQLKQANKKYAQLIATRDMQEELKLAEENQQRTIRHRSYAERRLKLGYQDGKDEVADPILDQLIVDEARYQKSLKDKRERKPIKQVVEVQGLSKPEFYKSMLKDDEKFKDVW